MQTETLQLYPDRPDVTLTSYVLSDSPELLDGQPRPAVLICPGGAYLGCSDREAEPVALRFAAMGYHTFVLRYSTYNEGKRGLVPVRREMPVNPNSVYPAPLRDVGKAFLTIRLHAGAWRVDMDKVALCGFSAGAHNAAMYATCWYDPVLTDFFGVGAAALRPAAAVLAYGLYDYHLMFGEITDPFAKQLSDAAAIAYLGTTTPSKDLLDTVSPALRVTERTPPTFLWTTAGDRLVPVENTTRMANALARTGVPFEVHIFEAGDHGLSLSDQATAAAQTQIDTDAAKWVGLAEAWLRKRFALPLPAEPAWRAAQTTDETNREEPA